MACTIFARHGEQGVGEGALKLHMRTMRMHMARHTSCGRKLSDRMRFYGITLLQYSMTCPTFPWATAVRVSTAAQDTSDVLHRPRCALLLNSWFWHTGPKSQ